MSLELDSETLELLGYGEPWPVASAIAYDLRAHDLEVKRVAAADARAPRLKRSTLEPCKGCGREFDHRGTGKGWLRSYCSDECRVRFHNRKATEARAVERPSACLECGKPIQGAPKRADGRGNRPKRFCGSRCARKAKRNQTHDRN